MEDDRTIAHGVVRARLILELEFEVVQARRVVVYGSYFAAIDATITEPWPPLVRDVQVETYQCLHPVRVDGDVRNDGARHREQKGMYKVWWLWGVRRSDLCASWVNFWVNCHEKIVAQWDLW